MTNETDIQKAAEALLAAKHTENLATAARIAAEVELLKLVPAKPVGSQTTRVAGFKIETKGVVNWSIDAAALEVVRPEIPKALFEQAVRYKPELIAAGVTHLRNNEPETYALLAQALTSKPGKTGVTVERVADEVREAA